MPHATDRFWQQSTMATRSKQERGTTTTTLPLIMADDDAADRASQEIKALIRRLDPNHSSHKDRIRRLNKFRNFVTGEGVRRTIDEVCRLIAVCESVVVLTP